VHAFSQVKPSQEMGYENRCSRNRDRNRHVRLPLDNLWSHVSKRLEVFFTLYHAGKVNIILHLVSFSFLFYGLTVKSVPLVLIGLFIFDEMGHAYNYFFVHNRDPRFGLRMIPYQLLYASLGMPVLLKLFGWF
jgi:hypothetical protein